uniref:sCTP-23166 n=1 Tax=Paulinella chromatophora TaxID=39717 RepID=UPI0025C74190|nr:Chain A, sCTP-23166 [Paulinella chromatophora]8B6E_B Chain B, sCTP-23166 [Paulinella chromatophora]
MGHHHHHHHHHHMAGYSRAVRCVETGVEYPSLSAAAKAMDLFGPQNIYKAIRLGKLAGGYHWVYVD